jgi:hypothetical protein
MHSPSQLTARHERIYVWLAMCRIVLLFALLAAGILRADVAPPGAKHPRRDAGRRHTYRAGQTLTLPAGGHGAAKQEFKPGVSQAGQSREMRRLQTRK